MTNTIIIIIFLAISAEALTELVIESEFPLFNWFRGWLKRITFSPDKPPKEDFLQYFKIAIYKLLTCGYCFSVWSAGFFALFSPINISNWFISWFISTMLIHRLSNTWHIIYELIMRGRVRTYDITLKQPDEDTEDYQEGIFIQNGSEDQDQEENQENSKESEQK